ncbi:MAG TPA: NAD(P)(+) transhydrogenase (Re/Si-specific) subunit alpha, partial [Candidatus Marinimicrobia bacterium]|nr:NAD(P)(+) transhydrogenase (Re/Si-specific) subunit alpha [Candidatus Neomarinimicrobiota bacterium]
AENGGNCELTEKDRVVIVHNVTIDGTANIPSTVAIHATQLYSKNITSFIRHMFKDGELNLDLEDEIISGAMFTHNGVITHEPTKEALIL